jgi:hypothetical protein
VDRFGLGSKSEMFEIANQDGYLLRRFRPVGAAVLGFGPAANVAAGAP